MTGKMPPRSKLSKVEFVHCEVCGCRFSNKDQERHVDICQDGINIADLSHGFIKDGELHGLGVTVDGKGVTIRYLGERGWGFCLAIIYFTREMESFIFSPQDRLYFRYAL